MGKAVRPMILAAACLAGMASCAERQPGLEQPGGVETSASSDVTLLSFKADFDTASEARIAGSIRVNERGCLQVGNTLISVPESWSASTTADKEVVLRAESRAYEVGDAFVGFGAYVDREDDRAVMFRDCLTTATEQIAFVSGEAGK